MRRAPATAKINLALLVGPRRPDGKHEVVTVLQRLALCDRVSLRPADMLRVRGFKEDTLVDRALTALAERTGVAPRWAARITKRIPVAAGLGGGSSDAATVLRLANETLDKPLPPEELHTIARSLGADVPFFLENGPQLGTGEGAELTPLTLPQAYWVLLVLPDGATKLSTASVYEQFAGHDGFEMRRRELLSTLERVRGPSDLADLPPNDLASSPVADELRAHGAFRADVTGAGPAVYGLFLHRARALAARSAFEERARTWLTAPAWYG